MLQCYVGMKNVSTQMPFLGHKRQSFSTHVLRMHDGHTNTVENFLLVLFLYSTSRLYSQTNVCVCVKSVILYNRLMNCLYLSHSLFERKMDDGKYHFFPLLNNSKKHIAKALCMYIKQTGAATNRSSC